ncbi:MAG: hypothetical protein ACYDG6_12705 [Thermincolia bacterium]
MALLAAFAGFKFSALAAVGLVFGFFLIHGNILLLDIILKWLYGMGSGMVKVLVMFLYYCRFAALAAVLYGCYLLFGQQFIGGSLGGMLLYKLFFVSGNIKKLFQ